MKERRALIEAGELAVTKAGDDMPAALLGAEMMLRADFDRSFDEAAEVGTWNAHPTFETYVAGADLIRKFGFPANLVKAIWAKYLPRGSTSRGF